MANRMLDTELWSDSKISDDFTPEDKYFWLFLLTTRYGNLSGCFEVTVKQIGRDMGYSEESVRNLIYRFQNVHKMIAYDDKTKELYIFNWFRYNWTKSPKFEKALMDFANKIKNQGFKEHLLETYENYISGDTVLIPYLYGSNTNTISNTNTKPKSNNFTPPTLEQVKQYCQERNNQVDASKFIDFYTSKGWMVGKNKMKDWKASVRTWEKDTTSKNAEINIGFNSGVTKI